YTRRHSALPLYDPAAHTAFTLSLHDALPIYRESRKHIEQCPQSLLGFIQTGQPLIDKVVGKRIPRVQRLPDIFQRTDRSLRLSGLRTNHDHSSPPILPHNERSDRLLQGLKVEILRNTDNRSLNILKFQGLSDRFFDIHTHRL